MVVRLVAEMTVAGSARAEHQPRPPARLLAAREHSGRLALGASGRERTLGHGDAAKVEDGHRANRPERGDQDDRVVREEGVRILGVPQIADGNQVAIVVIAERHGGHLRQRRARGQPP